MWAGAPTYARVADVAVLSQDIFTISSEQLPATKSVLTMIDGKICMKKKTKVMFLSVAFYGIFVSDTHLYC